MFTGVVLYQMLIGLRGAGAQDMHAGSHLDATEMGQTGAMLSALLAKVDLSAESEQNLQLNTLCETLLHPDPRKRLTAVAAVNYLKKDLNVGATTSSMRQSSWLRLRSDSKRNLLDFKPHQSESKSKSRCSSPVGRVRVDLNSNYSSPVDRFPKASNSSTSSQVDSNSEKKNLLDRTDSNSSCSSSVAGHFRTDSNSSYSSQVSDHAVKQQAEEAPRTQPSDTSSSIIPVLGHSPVVICIGSDSLPSFSPPTPKIRSMGSSPVISNFGVDKKLSVSKPKKGHCLPARLSSKSDVKSPPSFMYSSGSSTFELPQLQGFKVQ